MIEATRVLPLVALSIWFAGANGVSQGQTPPASPQREAVPPRDASPKAGTGMISGTVLTDDLSPRPVRRAHVVLSAGDLRYPQMTVTDETGRFAFAGLPAGNYSVVGTKLGYVSAYYGGKHPGRGPGVPIALLDGQRAEITMKMLHGGVITGTVRAMNGQPMQGLNVQVYQVDPSAAGRRLSLATPNVTTDEEGTYRAFGLAPGDYVVQVTPGYMLGGEARLVTPSEIRWADQQVAAAASLGGAASVGPPPEPGATVTYAAVYYPGTPDLSGAAVVTLGPTEVRSGADIVLTLVPTARVTGSVFNPDGHPMARAQVSIAPAGEGSTVLKLISGGFSSVAMTSGDGSFSINGVTPGSYTVTVRTSPPAVPGAGSPPDSALQVAARMFGGQSGVSTLWAETDVTIGGRDVTDLVLRLEPGMTVSGKVIFDLVSGQPPDVTHARISLMPPSSGPSALELTANLLLSTIPATVADDGTFSVKGVAPNRYRVTTTGLGMLLGSTAGSSGLTLKSAMLAGRDVADQPFDVRPREDVSDLVVTFTDHPTELSGSVLDAAGRPASGFPIVVFSTDRAYWTIGSRRVQLARPSSDGRYRLIGLPAGDYLVCAVTDLDQNQLYNPSFLETLIAGSFKITLADGQKKVQDLKLAR